MFFHSTVMPRIYQSKEGVQLRKRIDIEILQAAVKAVRDGDSLKSAAKSFNIDVMR